MGKQVGEQRWNQVGTASVMILRPLLTYVRSRGLNTEPILQGLGLSFADLDDIDRRIPEDSRCRTWVQVAELTGEPDVGLRVVEHAEIGALDVLDYSLCFSSTLGQALDHILRFHRVLCDAWRLTREVRSGVVHLRATEKMPPPATEAFFAYLLLRGRALSGHDLVIREMRFAHRAPADTNHHAALFGCPVRFGASASEMSFPTSNLALPVRTANPGVERVLERHMNDLLGRLPKSHSFVDAVRHEVSRTIDQGRPDLGTTARRLHASPRTVQRRLGEQGFTFQEVVDSVRRSLAERLVGEGRLSLTEIAFLLGFSDLSGFRRKYKHWTGSAPSRGRLRAQASPEKRASR